ncbi:hypothetical protein HY065_01515, partial [Candidatus Berkelbacteria bacterium]|nr:hypothetical protein [Candidatus Berkelbacteria bacterium]
MPDTTTTREAAQEAREQARRERESRRAEQKREAEILTEFAAQKQQAALFEVEGFADSSKQAELRRYLAQRDLLTEKIFGAKQPKIREDAMDDLEIVNKKIGVLAQEAREEAIENNQPPLDKDGMRVLIDHEIPANLKDFVQKHCKFIYDPAQESDAIELRKTDKIEFIFGKNALMSQTQTTLENGQRITFFDPTKLIFQIRRMVGALLAPPPNWEKHKKNIKQITRRGDKPLPPTWEDFVALYITDKETAQSLSTDAAAYLDKLIQSPDLRMQEIRERLA